MRQTDGTYIKFGRLEVRTRSFWLAVIVSVLIFLTCIYAIDSWFRYARSKQQTAVGITEK